MQQNHALGSFHSRELSSDPLLIWLGDGFLLKHQSMNGLGFPIHVVRTLESPMRTGTKKSFWERLCVCFIAVHSNVSQKSCPGNNLVDFLTRPKRSLISVVPPPPLPPQLLSLLLLLLLPDDYREPCDAGDRGRGGCDGHARQPAELLPFSVPPCAAQCRPGHNIRRAREGCGAGCGRWNQW